MDASADMRGHDDGDAAALEPYRLSRAQWRALQQSAYFQKRPDSRLPPLDGVSNTIRASYRGGWKLYSQFVPLPPPAAPQPPGRAPEGVPCVPYRFFTPRECARLQGFPDWFRLGGGSGAPCGDEEPRVAEASQYQAVGNAVSPPVVASICRAILDALPALLPGRGREAGPGEQAAPAV